jgi:hypothetical protein
MACGEGGGEADSCLSVAQLGEHEDQVVRTPQIVRMPRMRVPEPAAQQRTRAQRGDAPGSGGARAQCGQRGRCVGNCTPRWRVGSCCVGSGTGDGRSGLQKRWAGGDDVHVTFKRRKQLSPSDYHISGLRVLSQLSFHRTTRIKKGSGAWCE